MIRVGIAGASGYSGYVALEILLRHPNVRLTYVSALNTQGPVEEIWPQLKNKTALACEPFNLDKALDQCDVVLLALPHATAMGIAPKLLKAGKRVIDFSGDYRLKRAGRYKKWYGVEHTDSGNLGKAVYGLPELFREKIRKAALIANPGCYPTAAILGLAPILSLLPQVVRNIIIDAKSGVSGAGKKMTASLMFCEVNENFKAYKVLSHQHTPEMEQCLTALAGKPIHVTFVPHLLPVNRGILATMYVQLQEKMSAPALQSLYKKFYKTEPFIRVLAPGVQPELKNVYDANYCDIALTLSSDRTTLVVTSAIDNLVKGAAGQAIQNLNIMCGFDETEALL